MKIKRFQARSMREAIRLVREEQGPDAVILSNRRVGGEIEVVAAVDYDASLLLDDTFWEGQLQSMADGAAGPAKPDAAGGQADDQVTLLAAVPSRDVVLMARLEIPGAERKLRDLIARHLQAGDHLISATILRRKSRPEPSPRRTRRASRWSKRRTLRSVRTSSLPRSPPSTPRRRAPPSPRRLPPSSRSARKNVSRCFRKG